VTEPRLVLKIGKSEYPRQLAPEITLLVIERRTAQAHQPGCPVDGNAVFLSYKGLVSGALHAFSDHLNGPVPGDLFPCGPPGAAILHFRKPPVDRINRNLMKRHSL
jgi:hypothetical protein